MVETRGKRNAGISDMSKLGRTGSEKIGAEIETSSLMRIYVEIKSGEMII